MSAYVTNPLRLAILGGTPVRQRPWPKWPSGDKRTEEYLFDVLESGQWAIGGKYRGRKLYEQRFAEAFAKYNNSAYCVVTSSGSAALTIALEALGVKQKDEVLVPGVAWIACASAVTRIGAIPVLVDVEPDTLCMSVDASRQALTARTAAIILIHSYCTVADLDSFVRLSRETGIPLIEDCSQAHGAKWRDRRVGTFGKVGVFSMGNSKLLACGEGGAAITDDLELYDRLQQLRADGYRYRESPLLGQDVLDEVGAVQGHNYSPSEFQSAVLLDRLDHLDEENRIREANGEHLRRLLLELRDVRPLSRNPAIDELTFFRFCVRVNRAAFGNATIEQLQKALDAELNAAVEPVDGPLNSISLYKPFQLLANDVTQAEKDRLDPSRFSLPISARARDECLTLHHKILLAPKEEMTDVVRAFRKLEENKDFLAQL